MGSKINYEGLDRFKIIAALLVIAIHTGPLMTYSDYADFVLTSIISRVAVPFFFMASGFFLYRKLTNQVNYNREVIKRFCYKIGLIYLISIVLYLPLNFYAKHFKDDVSPYDILKIVLFDGTFYHLWYLPALILGALIVYFLSRKLSASLLLVVTGLLYTIGLFGDSYYGLAEHSSAIQSVYAQLFILVDYTRNGLFFAPIFLALGIIAAKHTETTQSPKANAVYLAVSLILLFVEGMMVNHFAWPRHDSMYIFLIPVVYLLFRLLIAKKGTGNVYVRNISLWIYLLHPLAIVLVRAAAKLTDSSSIFVTNSLIHYISVTALSIMLALAVVRVVHVRTKNLPEYRAWREINLAHLEHNLLEIERVLPAQCEIMAVVKADAYGHGSIQVTKRLSKAGVRSFAVAEISEGILLRKHGVKGDILVLGETCESRIHELRRYKLQQTVISEEYGRILNDVGKKVDVHVKIDTGMNRLGEGHDQWDRLLAIYRQKNLRIVGTYSHLSGSDRLELANVEHTHMQIKRFDKVITELRSIGIDPGILHIQSSYGIVNYPELNYGLVRPGIALYGVFSHGHPVQSKVALRPVLALKARIVLVKYVQQNSSIGYGCECITTQVSKVATISIGYADGVPRELSANGGCVLIKGQKVKIISKICMDHFMVDVTSIDQVQRGDIATLIGQYGEAKITAEEVAEQCGTITNEILSRIGNRVGKVVVN